MTKRSSDSDSVWPSLHERGLTARPVRLPGDEDAGEGAKPAASGEQASQPTASREHESQPKASEQVLHGPYRVLDELARGGMGVVLRGRDEDLGREVALKVLLGRHAENPEVVQRFVEEAQIGGQLQHPGIVPIYRMGLMADQRPYFSMKLVRGQTLAAILAERSDAAADRPRLLTILAQVTRAMAYAHSRAVVHRDLKPANVMVGRFGEVQVVDWGLAKVLGREQPESEVDARQADSIVSLSDDAARTPSLDGTIVGSPAYMPPEQAQGRIEAIDPRSDVFALGAMLCEVLTGEPPYGGTIGEALRQAADGALNSALERLQQGVADRELLAMVQRCLAPRAQERFADAGELAAVLDRYLESVEQRAQQAELEAARARDRAEAERRTRRLTLRWAAAVVAILMFAGGGAYLWREQTRQRMVENSRTLQGRLSHAAELKSTAIHAPIGEAAPWAALQEAADGTRSFIEGREFDLELLARARSQLEEVARAIADRKMYERLELLLIEGATNPDRESWERMDADFEQAFRDYGIDVWALDFEERIERMRASSLSVQLADSLELWMNTRLVVKPPADPTNPTERFAPWLEMIFAVDPDPFRTSRRRLAYAGRPDAKAMRELVEGLDFDTQTPRELSWLATGVAMTGDLPRAVDVFREAVNRHPDDALLHFDYAYLLQGLERWDEVVTHLRCALALRPRIGGLWRSLATAYQRLERPELALPALERAGECQPHFLPTQLDLGRAYERAERFQDAIATYRLALEIEPRHALIRGRLGICLMELELFEDALPHLEQCHRWGQEQADWKHPSETWLQRCREALNRE